MMKRLLALLCFTFMALNLGLLSNASAQTDTIRIVTAQQNANVRQEPTSGARVVGSLAVGGTAHLLGETEQGEMVGGIRLWYLVRLPGGVEGWVWSGTVTVSEVVPTPLPTPRQTLVPHPDFEPITVDNASDLRWPNDVWGQGMQHKVAWSRNGAYIAVATTTGLWVYNTNNLEAGARAVYSAPRLDRGYHVGQMDFIGSTTNVYMVYGTNYPEDGLVFEVVNVTNGQRGAVFGLTVEVQGDVSISRNLQVAAVSGDGRRLALVDSVGVRLIDLNFARLDETIANIVEREPLELGQAPEAIAFSPDGSHLAVNIGTRTEIYRASDRTRVSAGGEGAERLLYSPDGARLYTLGSPDYLTLDATTGETLQRYEDVGFPLFDAALHPDGSEFAVTYGHLPYGIRGYDTAEPVESRFIPVPATYSGLAYNRDGTQLAGVGHNLAELTIWDTATGEVIYRDNHYVARGPQIAFADDGETLVVSAANQRRFLDLNNLDAPVETLVLPQFMFWNGAEAALRSDRMIVNAGREMQVFTLDGEAVSEPVEFELVFDGFANASQISAEAISPDGDTVLLARRDGSILMRDGETLAPRTTLYQNCCRVDHLAYSDDGRFFVSAGEEYSLYVWTADGERVRRFDVRQDAQDGVQAVAISAEGAIVASATSRGVYSWDVASGERRGPYLPEQNNNNNLWIGDITLSPDGALIAVWSTDFNDHTITLFDVQTAEIVGTIETLQTGQLSFTPNGALLIGASFDLGLIHFWGVPRPGEPAPTNTPRPAPTATRTPLPTATATMTHTPAPTSTPTLSPTPLPTATATPEPVILFEDDFEDRARSLWATQSGHALVEEEGNHLLRLDNDSPQFVNLLPPMDSAADYSFEANIRFGRGSPDQTDFFMSVRSSAVGGYSGTFDTESQSAGLMNAINGDYPDLGTVATPLPLNQWLKVRIDVSGDRLQLYIDDMLIVSANNRDHSAGWAELVVGPGVLVDVDNLRIWTQP
jgi:WD40 repeat protein